MPTSRNRLLAAVVAGLVALALVAALPSTSEAKRRGSAKAKAETEAKLETPEPPADLGPPVVDSERALQHASVLATDIGERFTNDANAKTSASYIADQLTAMGLRVERQEVGTQVRPAINLSPLFSLKEETRNVSDPNLVVRFAAKSYAKDQPLLFMAHYDTVPNSPGAVDNAVSVGLLLELARVLILEAPTRRVIIAFTAGEEVGLLGARALADALGEDVGLAVALDLIGAPGTLTLNGLSTLMGRPWLMWFAEVSKQCKVHLSAPWTHRVVSQLFPEIERADHGPFTARGIPAIHLYNRGSEPFLAYHTRHDTMSAVDKESTADAGKLIEMMTRTNFSFPKAGGAQGLWVPFPGGAKVASSLAAQALELMFLLFGIMSIARLHRNAKDARALAPLNSAPQGRGLGLAAALVGYLAVWLLTIIVVGLASSSSHPQPWAHSPFRYIAPALVLAAALAYLWATQLGRLGQWRGDARYLVMAIAWTGLLGFLMLAFSIFELAWIFLWPTAALGGMARVKSRGAALLLLALAALPLLGPLSSSFLREAVFHGFLPVGLPLAALCAFFVFPYALALVFLLRRWPIAVGKGMAPLALCGALALIAIATIASHSPPCSGTDFKLRKLSCELEK